MSNSNSNNNIFNDYNSPENRTARKAKAAMKEAAEEARKLEEMERMRIEAKEHAEVFGFVEQIVYNRAELYDARKEYLSDHKMKNVAQKLYVVNSNPVVKKKLQEEAFKIAKDKGFKCWMAES